MIPVTIPSLLLLASSVSASLFSRTSVPPTGDSIILPQNDILPTNVRGNSVSDIQGQADMKPSVMVTTVFNETRGSGFHPFACWDHPDFFSGQKRKWTVGTKHNIELECWTNPVYQTAFSKGNRTPWTFASLAFDNDIIWFNSPREKCWFPDFVVQKDAQYGPSMSTTGTSDGSTAAATTAATTSKGNGGWKGPPWLQWMKSSASGGGAPWMWWLNFVGTNAGPSANDDLRNKLRYCPTPVHQVGSFREQYAGSTYCYRCTRLDCDNKQVSLGGVDRNTELECFIEGDKVESDVTWWKLKSADECYIPNQVFEPTLFLGNAGKCVKK